VEAREEVEDDGRGTWVRVEWCVGDYLNFQKIG